MPTPIVTTQNTVVPYPQTKQNSEHISSEPTSSDKNSAGIQVLQATLLKSDFVSSSDKQSLKLLYQAALDGINEASQEIMGDNAIQQVYEQGIDVSPEATAERITSMSTSFFSAYAAQHEEEAPEEVLNNFMAIIRGGIDQGFAEAREILQGLQVLNGSIASDIDATYDLVQQGLELFYQSQT